MPESIKISVLLCTHNPTPDYLRRVLEGLRNQTLPLPEWELLLVDNASRERVSERFDLRWHPHGRHILFERTGKTGALLHATTQAEAPVLITVDDDNVLAPDYLARAVKIGETHPELGAWGGNVRLCFEEPPPDWTRPYWPLLAERKVEADAIVCNTQIAEPLPVGAGCCVRREVMEHFAQMHATSALRKVLGRTGASLLSGEDTDIVLCASDIGLSRGVFTNLALDHLIPASRLSEDYLLRLTEGIRFSCYLIEMARHPGKVPPRANAWWWLKLGADCLVKFGRKRRFYLANKRAQRKAREFYDNLCRERIAPHAAQ
jgi:glycosyltransferase involved in cell wall biosynthesis